MDNREMAERALDALDEACLNNTGRWVSWHGYTRDDRLAVIGAMLAALTTPNPASATDNKK